MGSGPLCGFTKRLSRNLWLLSCGSPGADVNGLLVSERVRPRFQELRSEFHYVLVETAAAGLYNDAMVLGQLADGVVLVIEAHASRREDVKLIPEICGGLALGAHGRLYGSVRVRNPFLNITDR